MKNMLRLIFFFTLLSGVSFAQVTQDDIALIQSMYGKSKRDLFKDYMKLTPKQDSAFWPIYDQYENERKQLGESRIRLLEDYANNYATLSDAKADELMKQVLDLNLKSAKLQQKYYGKVKKVLPALKAAQFSQLEIFLDNSVRTRIQSEIPFIGELERH